MFQVGSAVARSLAALLSFCALTILLFGRSGAQESLFDKAFSYRASDYCRSATARPIALSDDQAILCLDGLIERDTDLSPAKKLKEGGLFVVRSAGGHIASAIALADVLRERRAVVVVYDQCLSSCANYLLIASDRSYVLKGALVAWDYESSEILLAETGFYKERMVDPYFEPPPDNRYLRKVVKSLYPDTHAYHHIGWTLHPRYFASLFKTMIVYESYPEGQVEVDEMVARLRLRHEGDLRSVDRALARRRSEPIRFPSHELQCVAHQR